MKSCYLLALALVACTRLSVAQEFSEAIEDNSFFIEEAINQEDNVVQHISNAYVRPHTHDFLYTFTQEWPVGGQAHQLSYMVAYESPYGQPAGFGDTYLNYRFQLCDGSSWAWIAPRLSIILPTGNSLTGLGSGVTGFQVNIPVSKRWSDLLVTHFNAGMTLLPGVEGVTTEGAAVRKTLPSYFAGVSAILLLAENVNLMAEVFHTSNAEIAASGEVTHSPETIVSPGVRGAVNFGTLQIVPGLALPVSITPSVTTVNSYFYLSFEHPF